MSQKHVLIEHVSNVNSVIKQSLQLTQRIKFTCFDVSQNYLVFGASSGGLYVCHKNPYAFKKLVPTKEGSVVDIRISPTEKFVALTSVRGLVVVIQDAFAEDNVQYETYSEHEGSLVTAMQWCGDDLYCGDQEGKISVISLVSKGKLMSKAIFQMPCSSLMTLDSSIVQIDTCLKYLLISTHTRTYFCDTEKERYKQIGKKLRDGCFGACFFQPLASLAPNPTASSSTSMGVFNKPKETDQMSQTTAECKMFAARPGSRIWEVGTDATVICTHQFKNTLTDAQLDLLHVKDEADTRLNASSEWGTPESPIFGRMLCLANKYLLTYNTNGIYIIDPATMALIHWTHYFINIKTVKTCGNYIYILTDNIKIKIIALYELEEIVLKSLFTKQYYLCTDLCLKYAPDILQLIEQSDRIHLITVLREKLNEMGENELLRKLEPVLNVIVEFSRKMNYGQKLDSGIVVVNNLHVDESMPILYKKSRSENNLQSVKEVSSAGTSKEQFENEESHTEETHIKIMQQQFEYNKIHPNLETGKFIALLHSADFEQVIRLFINVSTIDDNKELKNWCNRQCLKQLLRFQFSVCIENLQMDCAEMNFILNAFTAINKTADLKCKCGYPLPLAKNHTPEFYEIGCELLKKAWDNQSLAGKMLEEIPYLRKYVLEHLQENREISVILPLLIQYSDQELLKQFFNKFTYDVWDNAIQFLIKLKRNLCLNCDNKFPTVCDTIPWNAFGSLMVQSLGGPISVQLLLRYANFIPCTELGADLFQTCVFATATDYVYDGLKEKSVDFINTIKSDSNTDIEFNNLMSQFLNGKHKANGSVSMPKGSLYSVESMNAKCNFCDLPIVIPILSDSVKMECSHIYHSICVRHIRNVCIKCREN